MKIGNYRISAGHYAVGEFTIYGCYPRWQVREFSGDLLEDFATLREAIRYAHSLNVKSALKSLSVILSNPKIVEMVNEN